MGRLVDQGGADGETGLHGTPLAVRLIVPSHHVEHGLAVPGTAVLVFPVIDPLVSGEILITPARDLIAAGEIAMHGHGGDDAVIAELAEEIHARGFREIIGRAGLVVAVGVNDRQPFAGEDQRMRQRPVSTVEVVVIVTHDVGDALGGGAEAAVVRLVKASEAGADAPLHGVEDIVVGDAHARGQIAAFRRWSAEMLAEEHRVIA